VAVHADYIARADRHGQNDVVLCEINLKNAAGAETAVLRLADREFSDAADKQWWAKIKAIGSIDYGGSFLGSDYQYADTEVEIRAGTVVVGGSSLTIHELLDDYRWIGSRVELWQSFTDLTSANAHKIFFGEIAEVVAITPLGIKLHCVQKRDWVVRLPTARINRNDWPEADDKVIGMPVPIMMGNFMVKRKTLDPSFPSSPIVAAFAGIARGAVPTIMVAPGADGNQAKYLVCDNSKDVGLSDSVWHTVDGVSQRFAISSHAAVDTTDPYVLKTVATNYYLFNLAIMGASPFSGNNANNWFEAVRESKDYTLSGHAVLDFDAGYKLFKIQLPEIAPRGEFQSAQVRFWYSKNATGVTAPKFGITSAALGNWTANLAAAASTGHPSDTPLQYASTVVGGVARPIVKFDDVRQCQLYAEVFNAGDVVYIHRICLTMEYFPRERIQTLGAPIYSENQYNVLGRKADDNRTSPKYNKQAGHETTAEILYHDSPIWHHAIGSKDTVGGRYTGAASQIIEHPANMINFFLGQFCGIAEADVVDGTSEHGSFKDIRTDLADYEALGYWASDIGADDLISGLADQFLMQPFIFGTGSNAGKFGIFAWTKGGAADYRSTSDVYKFKLRDFVGKKFDAELSPIVGVKNQVTVNFDYDIRTKTFAESVFITDTDSRGWTGSAYARDQNTTAPDDRESQSADSVAAHGAKEYVVNMRECRDGATATEVRERIFDWLVEPLVLLEFNTWLNASDLERGQIIQTDDSLDSYQLYPKQGGGGSWSGKNFQVYRIARRATKPVTYKIFAVET
jgi:hypothetical protein